MAMYDDGEDEHDDTELLLDNPAPDSPDEDIVLDLPDDHLSDQPDDNDLVKILRAKAREQTRRALEAEARIQREASTRQAPPVPELGEKPTLEGCDWDPDKFETSLVAYNDRKTQIAAAERQAQEGSKDNNRRFEEVRAKHLRQAGALKSVENFDELEGKVSEAIGDNQLMGLAMMMLNDSARTFAAVGRNETALARLQAETDPVLKVKMLRDWEDKNVTKRKAPPPPEAPTIQRSTAPVGRVNTSKDLEKLEAQAAKTGNRTPVIEYKRAQKAKEAARR